MKNEILWKEIQCYELQILDCNCNNCGYMVRNIEKFNDSLTKHHKWQLDYFNTIKDNLITKAKWWLKKGNKETHDLLIGEADKMKFQFDKSTCAINYGTCSKLDKEVSFIPNTCQLETQSCFKHRKDLIK